MSWVKLEKPEFRTSRGNSEVTLGPYGRVACTIAFGTAAVRRWRLDRYKSVTVHVDKPKRGEIQGKDCLLAFQLYEDGSGEHSLTPSRGELRATYAAMKPLNIIGGRYKFRPERESFLVAQVRRYA